jgi:hypothetical protein
MVKYLAFVTLLLASAIVFAEPVDIGTFDNVRYSYETTNVEKIDNSVRVWVVSVDDKFNVTHDKKYVGMAIHLEIDCSGHTAGLIEEATFDKHGNTLVQGKIRKNIQFWPITIGKMTHELYMLVCKNV